MAVISIGFFPPNTKKNTSLAKSCCQEWTSARNRKSAEEDKPQGPENLLENPDIHELNYWIHVLLPKFETKRENFTLTPQHHLKEHKRTLTSGTTIAEHALNTNYDTDWADASVVVSHPHLHARCALETWHIRPLKHNINREQGL